VAVHVNLKGALQALSESIADHGWALCLLIQRRFVGIGTLLEEAGSLSRVRYYLFMWGAKNWCFGAMRMAESMPKSQPVPIRELTFPKVRW